ncbi:N-6 DNA methylase [Spirosoma montaniterrae]|uniref:site-specific DNA-methyltransferase (adenine-specific) n=1 Tax=Spirosoma montaniterrae TaxID=1178516 RepID=A0A1P9X2M1_9BACT|nr:N-6 DNA methylase [Spirosoma montaniterrae]AQG81835.1 hypothetical protein AWR27_22535 [Spirosoma montaniterrae]
MIQSAIQQLISRLGFTSDVSGNLFVKTFAQHKNYKLEVDLVNRRIVYAEPVKVHDKTTSHFDAPENFVVLECVNRLLEKGYEPQHIELERRWSLGRTGKSGKADVTVMGRDGQSLIVIECKTAGSEYEKEKRNTTASGGQLFSYLQQDRNTRFLCLYASELRNAAVHYENAIVQIKDRPEVTELVRTDPDTVAYETAKTKEELHRAWKENFNCYFAPNGIFDEEAQAYNPEFKPIKRKDLRPFTPEEGRQLFNAFEEILRHNNISDRSNAFNRILSLILCKIVDERKQPNEETGFQVKEATDTPESIQERLQRLYQQGMQDYLKEEFTYISEEQVDEIVSRFPRQTAQREIREIVRKLKFYSNNEFAFKEVHNESLFNENAKVLNEILALLQYKQFRYQRTDAHQYKHQKRYLGDFFELLLDAGYKQTAGQFFTPLPVARFIVKSLPLREMMQEKLAAQRPNFLPYVIDYACGSGHFLTEVMEEIQHHIDQLPPTYSDDVNQNLTHWQKADWTGEFIYGIEKDYRLARTAKVACFMNGDGEANIIFGDGLEDYTRPVKGRNYKFAPQFDAVVANPPYSIQSFKTHLGLKNSQFSLYDSLTESASEIEVLFVERTAQLLREGGVAGVVLPSSILSNTGIYTRARELMLQRFELRAIVEFGSNTFMATGTNTVTLFLTRRNDRLADDFRAVADDFILKNQFRPDDFTDTEALLAAYASRHNLSVADYRSLLSKTPTEVLLQSDLWRDYDRWFADLTETKNRRDTKKAEGKAFAKLSPDEQQQELTRLFYERVLPREHDRFLYFCLTYQQPTLIVRLPADGAEEKRFLGYEFSRRRGDEGIKLYQDAQGRHQTTLYDEEELHHPDKLNTLVWQALSGRQPTIPDALRPHANVVDLADCLDVTRVEFEKQIGLATQTTNSALYWTFVKQGIPLTTLNDIKNAAKTW